MRPLKAVVGPAFYLLSMELQPFSIGRPASVLVAGPFLAQVWLRPGGGPAPSHALDRCSLSLCPTAAALVFPYPLQYCATPSFPLAALIIARPSLDPLRWLPFVIMPKPSMTPGARSSF